MHARLRMCELFVTRNDDRDGRRCSANEAEAVEARSSIGRDLEHGLPGDRDRFREPVREDARGSDDVDASVEMREFWLGEREHAACR